MRIVATKNAGRYRHDLTRRRVIEIKGIDSFLFQTRLEHGNRRCVQHFDPKRSARFEAAPRLLEFVPTPIINNL
jgi:hypothetical protein